MLVHASAVAFDGYGILITGAPGSGKTSLMIQLMAQGAQPVADDQVRLNLCDQGIRASAHEHIDGLIECRYVGILKCEQPFTPSELHFEVALSENPPRLPDKAEFSDYEGYALPRFRLCCHDAANVDKVRLLCCLFSSHTHKADYHLHAPE